MRGGRYRDPVSSGREGHAGQNGATIGSLHIAYDDVIRVTLAHGAYCRHAFRKGQNRADLDDLDITGDAIGNIHGGSKIGRIQSNL